MKHECNRNVEQCIHSLQFKLLLNQVLELVCPSTRSFDDFGFRVNQVVFDKVQAGFNVCILKLDKVESRSDLFLYRNFIKRIPFCFLHKAVINMHKTAINMHKTFALSLL